MWGRMTKILFRTVELALAEGSAYSLLDVVLNSYSHSVAIATDECTWCTVDNIRVCVVVHIHIAYHSVAIATAECTWCSVDNIRVRVVVHIHIAYEKLNVCWVLGDVGLAELLLSIFDVQLD